jgi:hypothetical protein
MEYSYTEVPNIAELEIEEERNIKLYCKQFGEVPPLNSAIPNRYGKW